MVVDINLSSFKFISNGKFSGYFKLKFNHNFTLKLGSLYTFSFEYVNVLSFL